MQILKNKKKQTVKIILNSILVLFTYFPFYFMIISSVKTNEQILEQYFLPVLPFHFENYSIAFERVIYYLFNSIIVCGGAVIGVILVSCMSAYIFARFKFPGKSSLFMLLLSFMMIPGILTLIPSFVLVANLNLVNNYWGVILPYIAFGQILFIFILRTFIEKIPQDLFDSSIMDGASHLLVFRNIVVPIARPILVSLALINILGNWNDFIWPLLVLSKENLKTVTVGLYAFTGIQQLKYGLMFAGFVIASVPLIIFFSMNMKYFTQGITMGAIKG